jgi:DNA mismatch repair protein MutS
VSRNNKAYQDLSSYLSQIYDLERIAGRVNTGLASPRDTLALGLSFISLRQIGELLTPYEAPLLKDLRSRLSHLAEVLGPLGDQVVRTQREDPPLVVREGGIFKVGTDPELDRLLASPRTVRNGWKI